MAIKPIKITFEMDGTGLVYDINEPMHFDGLLAWCLAPMTRKNPNPPGRGEAPEDIPLPLGKWHINGQWGWHASAIFPDDVSAETLIHWRKRFRQNRVELAKGNPNLTNGIYRDYNMPLPLVVCNTMTAYALGDRKRVNQLLKKNVKYLGKKTSMGRGRVLSINVEWIDEDLSLYRNGRNQRWLPSQNGTRLVRPRPPYWNSIDRVNCVEVGEKI